ncbi:expressed unknown protein [Seminavis robusta]|uniref:Uncharacterized protein n=1 Tax=Seminavis robusta TaxID=568900 RepID=A0A9N8DBZ2_9STRA|nr:expressed unknown protein [Seminavis robusta]|eukprot:Sro71_g039430.1 n/a (432) ;mRNA; f:78861-80156
MEDPQPQPQEEEIEINFRLDPEGRTARTTGRGDNTNNSTEDPAQKTTRGLCYEPTSVQTELAFDSTAAVTVESATLDELLLDCEISDSGLMPRTFWVPAAGTARCSLEQMALDVFAHHTDGDDDDYDPDTSGAEWWVQIRPSPDKVGRYAMHASSSQDDNDNDTDDKQGISFHWDKDEDLRILCGGNIYIHPHISTVTYLTSLGAPTLALNLRVNNLTGEWMVPSTSDNTKGYLSWPRFGKHLSFDGRFLHAAPSDLMEPGTFETQCQIPETTTTKSEKQQRRRHGRVTFLVNIWLNHKPFGVKPFPMIDKLSGLKPNDRVGLQFASKNDPTTRVDVVDDNNNNDNNSNTRCQWPMGNCDSGEIIQVDMPLHLIREQASGGGSLAITWKTPKGVQLSRTDTNTTASQTTSTAENNDDDDDKQQPAKQPRLE